jgi:hypothetical protein
VDRFTVSVLPIEYKRLDFRMKCEAPWMARLEQNIQSAGQKE